MFWNHFDPVSLDRQEIGTATIEFSDCDHARLTYSMGYFGDGEMPLERLTHVAGMKCSELGELAGDWLATIHPDEVGFWIETTVQDDGTYRYHDLCSWSGQIKVVYEENGTLAATFGGGCGGSYSPPSNLSGQYYEQYEVCDSGGSCLIHPGAMVFKGFKDSYEITLRFVRPID